MWSASTGVSRSMSRSIDAVSGEAGPVSIARVHAAEPFPGDYAVHPATRIRAKQRPYAPAIIHKTAGIAP